jgi:hypothetical protein
MLSFGKKRTTKRQRSDTMAALNPSIQYITDKAAKCCEKMLDPFSEDSQTIGAVVANFAWLLGNPAWFAEYFHCKTSYSEMARMIELCALFLTLEENDVLHKCLLVLLQRESECGGSKHLFKRHVNLPAVRALQLSIAEAAGKRGSQLQVHFKGKSLAGLRKEEPCSTHLRDYLADVDRDRGDSSGVR